jgi:hypothetical protein
MLHLKGTLQAGCTCPAATDPQTRDDAWPAWSVLAAKAAMDRSSDFWQAMASGTVTAMAGTPQCEPLVYHGVSPDVNVQTREAAAESRRGGKR